MINVHISPPIDTQRNDNGVGRVIYAQHAYLPELGINLVGPDEADLIVCHIEQGNMPRVDILTCHGLYWTGDPQSGTYQTWHHEANRRIIAAARRAWAITVPSAWVARPFQRDMRISPVVIGHGVEPVTEEAAAGRINRGYLLWNKNRPGDVCDPAPAVELARRGLDVVSTFGSGAAPERLHIVGAQPHARMLELVASADLYLATTCETFGIGTLEAMSFGVPILGYRHGGTADLVEHKVHGYLAAPGDLDDLQAGAHWLRDHYAAVSEAAYKRAQQYTWQNVMRQYAALYHEVLARKQARMGRVSFVITNHNYAQFVERAIDSAVNQSVPPYEVIIVDDGSTDHSRMTLAALQCENLPIHVIHQDNQGVAAARNNGIAAATGDYICCLDADDMVHRDFVRVLKPALEADRAMGIAYSGLMIVAPDGSEHHASWPPDFSWDVQSAGGVPPSNVIPSACLFRRAMWERAGGYQQQHAPGEDAEFWTRGLSVGYTAQRVTDAPLFRYRVHEGSASRTKTYKDISGWLPWIRDKQYPMAAPATGRPIVRSYHQPLVTVVIPVGPGHAHYVPDALNCLLGQTFRNWHVIVVDDTAEDETSAVLGPFPFVEKIHSAGLVGAGAARNEGLQRVTSPLVFWLDADDMLTPDALETLVRAYARGNGEYVYSDWYALRADGNLTIVESAEYDPYATIDRGLHPVSILMSADDARRVRGFDERMAGWEDSEFAIRCAVAGVWGRRVAQPLLIYRTEAGTRRKIAKAHRESLLAYINEKYAGYRTGEKTMPNNCCGGNGDALLSAKAALVGGVIMSEQTYDGMVRLEYIGAKVGTVTYKGVDRRREYRAGNNPQHRYINVHPDDVQHLTGMGLFRRVDAGRTAAPPPNDAGIPGMAELINTGRSVPPQPLSGPVAPETAQTADTDAEGAQRPADELVAPIQNEASIAAMLEALDGPADDTEDVPLEPKGRRVRPKKES